MSQRVACIAVRDRIRAVLEVKDEECEVMDDGQPPPGCGNLFIAVHPGSWEGTSGDADLEELFGVEVTVTKRLAYAPVIQWAREGWAKERDGLDALCRTIVVNVHKSYRVMNDANALLPTSTTPTVGPDGFVEPLQFLSGGRPEVKQADWFWADQAADLQGTGMAGVAQTVMFGRMKRVQSITGMT